MKQLLLLLYGLLGSALVSGDSVYDELLDLNEIAIDIEAPG